MADVEFDIDYVEFDLGFDIASVEFDTVLVEFDMKFDMFTFALIWNFEIWTQLLAMCVVTIQRF